MAETYKTIQGDTWDMISKKVYGAEKHMDFLMENNFPLLDIFIFPAGVCVNTPKQPSFRLGEQEGLREQPKKKDSKDCI